MGLTQCSQVKCSRAGLDVHKSLSRLSSYITKNQACASHLRVAFVPTVSYGTRDKTASSC